MPNGFKLKDRRDLHSHILNLVKKHIWPKKSRESVESTSAQRSN